MVQRGAALAALALIAAGCGGGGSKRLSFPEFQREANAICATYGRRVNALPRPTTLAELARVARQAAAYGRAERGALQALPAPSDAEPQWKRLRDDLDRVDALLPEVSQAGGQGNASRVDTLVQEGRRLVADANANANANALNLDDCRRA